MSVLQGSKEKDRQVRGKIVSGVGQLAGLVGIRDQHDVGAAVPDLPGNLAAGQGRVHRRMDGAGHLHGQVGDNPLVAVLGDLHDAIARGNA